MLWSRLRTKECASATRNVYIADTPRKRSVNADQLVKSTWSTNSYLSPMQCEPIDRTWPGEKCHRCDKLSLPCSDNHRAGEAFRQSIAVTTSLTSSTSGDLERAYISWQASTTKCHIRKKQGFNFVIGLAWYTWPAVQVTSTAHSKPWSKDYKSFPMVVVSTRMSLSILTA